jgi:hypothetical protein
MVGDLDAADPNSVQLRNIVTVDGLPAALNHPDGFFRLVKIEPVTFSGFSPATFSSDANSPTAGQSLTVVGYGSSSQWEDFFDYYYDNITWPGVAMEATLEVQDHSYCVEALMSPSLNETTMFCALASGAGASDGAGPCNGTSCVP